MNIAHLDTSAANDAFITISAMNIKNIDRYLFYRFKRVHTEGKGLMNIIYFVIQTTTKF